MVEIPDDVVEQIIELLQDREWIYDDNPPSNSCHECGATAKGSEIPSSHGSDCGLEQCIKQLRGGLSDD